MTVKTNSNKKYMPPPAATYMPPGAGLYIHIYNAWQNGSLAWQNGSLACHHHWCHDWACHEAFVWPRQDSHSLGFLWTSSQKERQRCDRFRNGKLPLMTEHHGCIEVPLTNHYKYLGGFLTRGGGKLQEIRARAACAMHNIEHLKKLTTRSDLDICHRRTLIRSFGISRLSLHSGTHGEFKCWHAAVYRLSQAVQGRVPDGSVPHAHMYQLADMMQPPMPLELMYISRLRLLFHLIKVADPFLIASILQNHQLARMPLGFVEPSRVSSGCKINWEQTRCQMSSWLSTIWVPGKIFNLRTENSKALWSMQRRPTFSGWKTCALFRSINNNKMIYFLTWTGHVLRPIKKRPHIMLVIYVIHSSTVRLL